jgi:hypothetical protein
MATNSEPLPRLAPELTTDRTSNQEMSEGDRDKRRRAHTEKKKKLANPLFYVSATRSASTLSSILTLHD